MRTQAFQRCGRATAHTIVPMQTTVVHDLCHFIDASPSPLHAAHTLRDRLITAQFTACDPTQPAWDLKPGRYFVQQGASIIAFVLKSRSIRQFRLIGAHTDSPHLRLKPKAAYHCEGCRQLGVEVYGGALLNSWLDRDLGLAGSVFTADGAQHLVHIHKPIARVPQLAIHLDRKINDDGVKLNAQQHLAPIWGLATDRDPAEALLDLLGKSAGVSPQAIVSHDLSLYDLTPSAIGGDHDSLLFAPRLDNLASCHAGLLALLADHHGDETTVQVLACFDHEEIGSASATGAEGPLLATTLERIAIEFGLSRSAYFAALASSTMMSADMAHAVHPNYADRHEPRHKPQLGQGPVLKTNHNQRYATTGATAAAMRLIARQADVPLQDFVARTDLGCGSTIGPITATGLGIAVADIGSPMLSMHSARECAATADHEPFVRFMTRFLNN